MAKTKTVDDYVQDIDAGLEYRRIFGREAAWKKIELNYLNDPTSDTAVGPNLVYAMGDSLISALVVPDPEFVVAAERSSGVSKAPIVESLDNSLIKKLRLKKHVDAALLSGFLYNAIILKVGYDSEFGWAPYYDVSTGKDIVGMTMTQFNKQGHRIESPDYQPGMPWVRHVLPHDFVVPWGTINLEDAPWAAHRIIRHIDYIKADKKYTNTGDLKATISMEDFIESYLVSSKDKQKVSQKGTAKYSRKAEFVELWEIRDRMTGEVVVINRDYPKFLRKAPDAIQSACGMPFIAIPMNKHPRTFWSTPPAYYLGQIQKTQFDISLQAEKQRRIGVLKFLFRKGAISKENLDKLLSSDVGGAIGVETQFPLNEIIAPLQTGNSYDSIQNSEYNRRDAREAIGFSRNQMGEFDASTRRTAKEASFVAQGADLRKSKKQWLVSDLYIDIIDKVNSLCFEYWKTPREILTDETWQLKTGTELKGSYSYDVSLSTKRSISRAERKVEALMLMMQFAQIPGMDMQSLFSYVTKAANDPSFSALLGSFSSSPPPASGAGAGQTAPSPNRQSQQQPTGGKQ